MLPLAAPGMANCRNPGRRAVTRLLQYRVSLQKFNGTRTNLEHSSADSDYFLIGDLRFGLKMGKRGGTCSTLANKRRW